MSTGAAAFAAFFAALYVAHHIGDYWVQSDRQAREKALPGKVGRRACLDHVLSYLLTQSFLLAVVASALGLGNGGAGQFWRGMAALTVSGVTHYLADRRAPLEWLVRRLEPVSGKLGFYRLEDGSGARALDQSFHIAFSVFVPALILAM